MPSKFVTKYSVLYTVFRGKMGESVGKYRTMGKVSRRLIKQCCTKGAQRSSRVLRMEHTEALGLIATAL